MPVPSSMFDISTTAASNPPTGSDNISTTDDYLRGAQAIMKQSVSQGTTIASASTITPLADGRYFSVTGTTTITTIASTYSWNGREIVLTFAAALTLTHNATTLILPGGASITTAAGDTAYLTQEGSGAWRCTAYQYASGMARLGTNTFTASQSLGAGANLIFEGTTADDFETTLTAGEPTADRTLTLPDKTGTVAVVTDTLRRGDISGLILSNNGTDALNDIDISAGQAADSTNAVTMDLTSGITKRLDASWAVGTNQGGLDTGAEAISTWYHVWLIRRSDTGVVDALFSTSASSPTMPTNYDQKRLIGSVYNDASSNITAFHSYETEGGGIEVLWDSPTLDVNLSNTLTTTARTDVVKVPTGYSVKAMLNINLVDASASSIVYLSCPDVVDLAPSASAAPLTSANGRPGESLATYLPAIRTNTSAQIRARANITVDEYRLATIGWEWSRR